MNKRIIQTLCVLMAAAFSFGAVAEEIDMLLVDRKLYELGYRDEACNGKLDEVTINALTSFQIANALEVTGQPDEETVTLLMSGEGKTEREYLSALAYAYNEISSFSKGSYGESVVNLQRTLKKYGYFRSETDGAFGDATEAAVYRFQLANGLVGNGVANSATQIRLYNGTPIYWEDFIDQSRAIPGDSGSHVRRLQLRLRDMGYFDGKCTGRYGEATQRAVSHFQSMNNLEVNGEADAESCKVLYSNAAVVLSDAQALRRGSSGAAAEKLCLRLKELGYPAADSFNIQTEIALLQFQIANGMEATGALDSQTAGRLNGSNVVAYNAEKWRAQPIECSQEQGQKVLKAAAARLGTKPELNSSFEFVQYAHLKCGQPLMEEAQLNLVHLEDLNAVEAGDVLLVSVEGRSFYAVATADGAVVYRAEDGYVVMSYLGMLDPREIYIWQREKENAARDPSR